MGPVAAERVAGRVHPGRGDQGPAEYRHPDRPAGAAPRWPTGSPRSGPASGSRSTPCSRVLRRSPAPLAVAASPLTQWGLYLERSAATGRWPRQLEGVERPGGPVCAVRALRVAGHPRRGVRRRLYRRRGACRLPRPAGRGRVRQLVPLRRPGHRPGNELGAAILHDPAPWVPSVSPVPRRICSSSLPLERREAAAVAARGRDGHRRSSGTRSVGTWVSRAATNPREASSGGPGWPWRPAWHWSWRAGTATATARLPAGDARPGLVGDRQLPGAPCRAARTAIAVPRRRLRGYIRMTGNWAYWRARGQEHFIAYSSANAAQAHTNCADLPRASAAARSRSWAGPASPAGTGRPPSLHMGHAAGGRRPGRHRQRGRHRLPGRLDGHRDTRHRARHRQWLDTGVHHAVQREGEAAAHRGGIEPGGLRRLLWARHRALRVPAGHLPAVVVSNSVFGSDNAYTGAPGLPAHRQWTVRPATTNYRATADRLLPGSAPVAQGLGGRPGYERQRPDLAVTSSSRVTNGIGGFAGDLEQIDRRRHP